MRNVRDYRFYEYQRTWLSDRSRFKIGMWSRQIGKTFTATFEIADDMAEGVVESRPAPWVILSRGERQAKEALRTAGTHLRAYGQAFKELETDVSFGDAIYKQAEIRVNDDVWCIALPANPDTARGYPANVYMDEFAIHKDSREIWGAAFPIVSAGWKLRVHSTPKGKGNKFYELMTADDPTWSRHTIDIYDAIKQGCPRDAEALRAGLADEELWSQEYELQWLDEATAWLPFELIFAAEDPDAGKPELYSGGPVFIGNDIAAGGGDLWVAWVWELVGDILWTREIVELRRATFAQQDATMDDLVSRYKVYRLAMDQTGMGEKPVEDAKRRYGAWRVEGVHFTVQSKLAIAGIGKQAFEDRKVRIPEGNPKLRADLHSLVKVVGPTGMVRFVASREGGSHADRTWAAFLGTSAADGGNQPAAGATVDHEPEAYAPARPGGLPGPMSGPLVARPRGTQFETGRRRWA